MFKYLKNYMIVLKKVLGYYSRDIKYNFRKEMRILEIKKYKIRN